MWKLSVVGFLLFSAAVFGEDSINVTVSLQGRSLSGRVERVGTSDKGQIYIDNTKVGPLIDFKRLAAVDKVRAPIKGKSICEMSDGPNGTTRFFLFNSTPQFVVTVDGNAVTVELEHYDSTGYRNTQLPLGILRNVKAVHDGYDFNAYAAVDEKSQETLNLVRDKAGKYHKVFVLSEPTIGGVHVKVVLESDLMAFSPEKIPVYSIEANDLLKAPSVTTVAELIKQNDAATEREAFEEKFGNPVVEIETGRKHISRWKIALQDKIIGLRGPRLVDIAIPRNGFKRICSRLTGGIAYPERFAKPSLVEPFSL